MGGLGKGTTRVLKKTAVWKGQESKDTPYDDKETPLYTFSSIEYKMMMKADEGTYSLYNSDGTMDTIYSAKKLNGLTFRVVITDADGVVVAKVNATSKWNSKFVAEVAA